MASIKKRGDSYRVTVSNGRDSTGKQLLETATFRPDPAQTDKQNQKALEVFAFEFEQKVKSGKYLDGEKISLKDFADTWFEEYAVQHLEPTTVNTYEILMEKHILPSLGHLKLSRIQPTHLNKLYNAMLKERKDGRPGGYSPTTVKRVHALISSIMGTAVKWNIVLDNPCERVSPPKQARNMDDIKFFTLEQCSAFLEAVDTDLAAGKIKLQHKVFFHLALFCGMRRGDDDDKIRLNQRKPSKYKGLSRFGPEKNLQRINKFMKERPIFYKNLIQMKENFRFYLRCFYCIAKVVILQFNSEKQDRISS